MENLNNFRTKVFSLAIFMTKMQFCKVTRGTMSSSSIQLVDNVSEKSLKSAEKTSLEEPYKIKSYWHLIIILTYFEVGSFYALYLAFTSAKIATTLFTLFLYQISIWGISAGAHRLWSHRTYKAKWPLRLLLVMMFTMAFQYSVIKWSRDHRVHHKFGDTNADPYNPKRGFFFSHIGWVFCEKHPDVNKKGQQIDNSDLESDPMLKFHHDYNLLISLLVSFLFPLLTPMYLWDETLVNSFYIAVALRWTITANATGLVNSAAHIWGMKPYDKNSSATENMFATIFTSGEAWHNYHHAFPWDYKTSEIGKYWTNSTTAFINFFASIGWAYDLKTVSRDIVQKRVERTGDGSHPVWGWNDRDLTNEQRKAAVFIAKT